MSVHDVPPELGEALSWRHLWRSRSFALLELVPDSVFSARAADRGLRLGIGQAPLEELDVQGVLQPVVFAAGADPLDFTDVAPFEPRITFREEEPAKEWQSYAWDNHGRPQTSALYSPWQLLYVDNVADTPIARVGLDVLRAPAEQRDAVLGTWRGVLEAEEARWHALDGAWRPLMKVLVRLQNRYLPEVTGQSRLLCTTPRRSFWSTRGRKSSAASTRRPQPLSWACRSRSCPRRTGSWLSAASTASRLTAWSYCAEHGPVQHTSTCRGLALAGAPASAGPSSGNRMTRARRPLQPRSTGPPR